MNDERNSGGGEVQAASGILRVIGFPGSFAAWGLECLRQILQSSGYTTRLMPLDLPPPGPHDTMADTDTAVCVLFGHGPVVVQTGIVPLRTIVFLDAPARSFRELLSNGADPVDAARMLTATLAPLASVLSEDGVLLVQRTVEMDPAATQAAIASHVSAVLTLPSALAAVCPPVGTSEPPPALLGQALTLLRQTVTPLENFVIRRARDPIVWPLACFYSGDYPNELASPFIEVAGRARILYYGPYFYLPCGRWRADVQIIVSGNMHDTKLAVNVYAGEQLARHEFKPAQGGLLQASLPFIVEQTRKQIEVHVLLQEGAIEGYLGLKQVLLHPIESWPGG
jgi:hypothetical protein